MPLLGRGIVVVGALPQVVQLPSQLPLSTAHAELQMVEPLEIPPLQQRISVLRGRHLRLRPTHQLTHGHAWVQEVAQTHLVPRRARQQQSMAYAVARQVLVRLVLPQATMV